MISPNQNPGFPHNPYARSPPMINIQNTPISHNTIMTRYPPPKQPQPHNVSSSNTDTWGGISDKDLARLDNTIQWKIRYTQKGGVLPHPVQHVTQTKEHGRPENRRVPVKHPCKRIKIDDESLDLMTRRHQLGNMN